jgi:sugar lactone lactonase YvrE
VAVFGLPCLAAAPPFQWVNLIRTNAVPTSLAADGKGNVFVAFNSEAQTLDLGLGVVTGRCIIAKCANDGRWLWNKVLLPAEHLSGIISVDSQGNCMFAGSIYRGENNYALFLAKLDSGGAVTWSKELHGSGRCYAGGLALRENGEFFVGGGFSGSCNFGNEAKQTDGVGLTAIFVASYSATNELRWVQTSTSNGGNNTCEGLSVNSSGDVFVTGAYEFQLDWGPYQFTPYGSIDMFVAGFSYGGALRWTATAGGPGIDIGYGVVGLDDGSCWVSGIVANGSTGPVQFGENVVTKGGFLARCGGTFTSAKNINNFVSLQMVRDDHNNIYSADTVLTSIGGSERSDAKISSFAADGSLNWSETWGGSDWDSIHRIAVNRRGDVFVAGYIDGTVSFGDITVLGGNQTYFITKLSDRPAEVLPVFFTRPSDLTLEEQESVEFSAFAIGTEPITYQWFGPSGLLQGETKTNLVIASANANQSGIFSVVASNSVGSQTATARLTVIPNVLAQVTTLAGNGFEGYLDSANPLLAQFAGPDGGGVTKDGVIFVGDAGNQVIRYILPGGEVGTWVGKPTVSGYREDVGTNALFNLPLGLSIDSVGDLLVADYSNHRVRKILGTGYRSSSLLAGDGTPGLLVGVRGAARLNGPNDLVELNGKIYFTEFFNHTVRCINSTGLVTVLAGNGVAGFRDAEGAAAQFNGPAGITSYGGDLYVTDWANNRVRKVTTSGAVTTIAGNGAPGFKSGLGTAAEFGTPNGICADAAGNLYVTEVSNSAVRRIDTNGWVSTLAGTGAQGFADGDRSQAMFNRPSGICMHPDGSLIVMDTYNYRVRRIVMDGKTNGWTRSAGFLTADLHPTLKVFGAVGERYRIESRDRLGQSDWSAVDSMTIERSPMVWVDERADGGAQRIYRAVKE